MPRFLAAWVVLLTTSAVAAASDRATTLRLGVPVSPLEAERLAQRMGQVDFALSNCKGIGLGSRPLLEVLMAKYLEGGNTGAMLIEKDYLGKQAKVVGVEIVCAGMLKLYGPNGSVLRGVLMEK
jgi:hypothetical protein